MALTLGQLVDKVRSRLGLSSSDLHQTHAEIAQMLQEGSHELADLVLEAFGQDAVVSNTNFSTTTSIVSINAPVTNIRRVDVLFDGVGVPIRRMNFDSDDRSTNTTTWYRGLDIYYWFQYLPYDPVNGSLSSLRFYPPPSNVNQVVIWYNVWPAFYTISLSTQTNSLGYDEYLVLDAAAKFAASEQRDTSVFDVAKAAYRERILRAAPKDTSQPEVIRNVRGRPGRYPWSGREY